MAITPITNSSQIVCENSGVPIANSVVAYSTVLVLQKVDLTSGFSLFQCNGSSNTVNYMTCQHWYVDTPNMKTGVKSCITNHYTEGLLHAIPLGQGQTNLAAIVLGAGLKCKVSGVPLATTAYRFCITQASPVNKILDSSFDMFGEWCATLALAQQSALATINAL